MIAFTCLFVFGLDRERERERECELGSGSLSVDRTPIQRFSHWYQFVF